MRTQITVEPGTCLEDLPLPAALTVEVQTASPAEDSGSTEEEVSKPAPAESKAPESAAESTPEESEEASSGDVETSEEDANLPEGRETRTIPVS